MGDLSLVVVLTAVFVAVLIAGQGLWWAWQVRRQERDKDLRRRLGMVAESESDTKGPRSLLLRRRDTLSAALGPVGAWLESLNQQAGRPTSVRRVVIWMVIWAIVGSVLLTVGLRDASGLLGLALAGLPVLALKRRADKRSQQISELLPEALDLLGRSLQAGYGLSEAMRVCAEEMEQPIAGEFGRVYEEHNLGRDFRTCLENLLRRNPRNFDLRLFTGSVLLQRDTGGNLVEIVHNIAGTVRARFNLQAKARALTAEARFSAYILLALPVGVALLIAILRPGYLVPLFSDPLGQNMLTGAATSYVLGIFVMRRLARLDD